MKARYVLLAVLGVLLAVVLMDVFNTGSHHVEAVDQNIELTGQNRKLKQENCALKVENANIKLQVKGLQEELQQAAVAPAATADKPIEKPKATSVKPKEDKKNTNNATGKHFDFLPIEIPATDSVQ